MVRLLALAAVVAAGITSIASVAMVAHRGAPVQASPATSINRCSNIQVMIKPFKPVGAAAGHLGLWYRIHDMWSSPCQLQGYPGMELLDRQFHSLPTHLGRGDGYIISDPAPARAVVLDQKHDAYFALEYSDVPIRNQPCPAAPYVMIIPPNDWLPVVTYSGIGGPCSGNINISPLESHLAWR